MTKVWISLSVAIFALGSAVFLYLQPSPIAQPFNPLAQLINNKAEGFATVEAGWQYVFPQDSGAHSAYRMDVWYFTGYLSDAQDRSFGFQMTFFRFALEPEKKAGDSAWTSREIYRAHLAITDVGGKQFHSAERFGRAGLGAGVSNSPIQIWLDDWEMRIPDETQSQFQLRAATKEVTLVLNLENIKQAITNVATGTEKPLFHGYWLPRLQVTGKLGITTDTFTVKGLASLTHVWGGVSLFRGQLALNRFVLQLDDNREILLLQLRRRDGSADPITTGLLIEPDGAIRRLSRQELSLSVQEYWQSGLDGVRYPTRWRLQIMADDLQLDLVPMLENQELILSQRYWAGLVRLSGNSAGQVLGGTGQVELTAYAPDPSRQ